MDELSTDEKIERLVRSVLEAVDQRLVGIREEIAGLTVEVAAKHHHVLSLLADVERRFAARVASASGEPNVGVEQATQMLLERIEAMHQRDTMSANERFARLSGTVDELRASIGSAAAEATSLPEPATAVSVIPEPVLPEPVLPEPVLAPLSLTPVPAGASIDFSVVTAPLFPGSPVTGRQPVIDSAEPIDLTELTSLLSERLALPHFEPGDEHSA